MPHYIIISESDDHEGVSLTAQCEIIQQNMLGDLLQDEDLPPDGPGDDFIPPGIGIHHPHVEQLFPQPQPMELPDLNAQLEQQNQDPVIQENEQVNEQVAEDNLENDVIMADLNPTVQNGQEELNIQPSDSYTSKALQAPMQVQDQHALNQHHIQIGQVLVNQVMHDPEETLGSRISGANASSFVFPDILLPTNLLVGPSLSGLNLNGNLGLSNGFGPISQPNKQCPDVYRLWAKHFSPVGCHDYTVQMPPDWAPFFIKMLLSPSHFEWAKHVLASQTWDLLLRCAELSAAMSFAIPQKCHASTNVVCITSMDDVNNHQNDTDLAQDDLIPLPQDYSAPAPLLDNGMSPVVDTNLRKSPS